ncbi:MAG: glycosyltransferase family 4 protein, partial [Thermoplasmata archaeon]
MRIIILTDELPKDISNVNVSIVTNAIYLSERGHEVFLISHPGSRIDNEDFKHFPKGFDVPLEKDSPSSFLVRNATFFCSSLTEIKDISPDLIWCKGGGQFLSNFLIGLFFSKLLDKPIVSEWTGSELLLKETLFRNLFKKYVLRCSSLNILQSDHMKEKALQLEPNSDVSVLPGQGVDMKQFTPVENPQRSNEDEIELLFVGRLHEVKGLTHLFEAFRVVKEDHSGIRLTLVGEGPLEETLKKEAEDLDITDSVEFSGEIDHHELPDYYRRADIFILPSFSEGLPNVIMEAMSCGLPVVATDVGGNKELVKSSEGG